MYTISFSFQVHTRMYIWSGRDGYRRAWNNQVENVSFIQLINKINFWLSVDKEGNERTATIMLYFRYAAKTYGFWKQVILEPLIFIQIF